MSQTIVITIAPASNVPFDNSTNGFISQDVQAAIEEIKNLLSNRFSRRFVADYVTVRHDDEMILSDYCELLPTGVLDISGLVTVLGA